MANIFIDSNNTPQQFLKENNVSTTSFLLNLPFADTSIQLYEPLVLGKFCEASRTSHARKVSATRILSPLPMRTPCSSSKLATLSNAVSQKFGHRFLRPATTIAASSSIRLVFEVRFEKCPHELAPVCRSCRLLFKKAPTRTMSRSLSRPSCLPICYRAH